LFESTFIKKNSHEEEETLEYVQNPVFAQVEELFHQRKNLQEYFIERSPNSETSGKRTGIRRNFTRKVKK